MSGCADGVSKESRQIKRMFASIAHRYDLLNRLLSFSLDRRWRRLVVQRLLPSLPSKAVVLDLCTGTGDLALELSHKARVIGCDFCHPMLIFGKEKINNSELAARVRFVEGDALQLPFPPRSFDAVTIAFGLRNLEDYTSGLREMFRVLRPGGMLVILEFSQPQIPVFKQFYLFYVTWILPKVGQCLSGKVGPYAYLPQSVKEFPDTETLERLIQQVGFTGGGCSLLTGGIVSLHLAQKPAIIPVK